MQLLKQNKMGNTEEALYVSLTCKYKNNEKRAVIIKYIYIQTKTRHEPF